MTRAQQARIHRETLAKMRAAVALCDRQHTEAEVYASAAAIGRLGHLPDVQRILLFPEPSATTSMR